MHPMQELESLSSEEKLLPIVFVHTHIIFQKRKRVIPEEIFPNSFRLRGNHSKIHNRTKSKFVTN